MNNLSLAVISKWEIFRVKRTDGGWGGILQELLVGFRAWWLKRLRGWWEKNRYATAKQENKRGEVRLQ